MVVDVGVRDAEQGEAERFEDPRSHGVSDARGIRGLPCPVHLDDAFGLHAGKVDDEPVGRVLAAERPAVQGAVSQIAPELGLGAGLRAP
ncbi:hypothetical protein JOE48_005836 [Methylobacterium sp. PvR107]|nr:hypothetical protein [Methylobacterium sp. PvR107]